MAKNNSLRSTDPLEFKILARSLSSFLTKMTEKQLELIELLVEYKIVLEKIDDFIFLTDPYLENQLFRDFRDKVKLEILKIKDQLLKCY